MCRNHSHLKATFVGENTQGETPVLMFVLADPILTIEAPRSDGAVLKIRTSGLLYVPSLMLAGLSAFHPQGMEAPAMSLFFSPDSVPIIIAEIATDLASYFETSEAPSSEPGDYLNLSDDPDIARQDLER